MIQLGIDIGGTSVKAAVWTNGLCTSTGQSAFYARPTTRQLHAAIASAVGAVDAVDAVGLCVPGLLDERRGVITHAVNVPGLVDQPLKRLVPQTLRLTGERPTVISNDAAAAAFHVYQTRRLSGRLLMLTLGTGIGNAVVDDGGVLLNMGGGASGHVGQFDVSIPGSAPVIGPDGGAGGLEGYLGVSALRQNYGMDLSDALTRFDGSEPALLALARAIRICHAIYRPHHVCLCGGVGIRLRHVLPALRARVEEQLTNVARPEWTLTCGDDDFHAARGAALMAGENAPPAPSIHIVGASTLHSAEPCTGELLVAGHH